MGSYALAGKELKVEAVVKDISCFGKQDGEIQLLITGGKAPYTVEWEDGAKEPVRSSLVKGIYSFKVVDSKGSYIESEVDIISPDPISVYFSQNSNCITSDLGEVNIAVEGGTPLSTNWDNRYTVSVTETLDTKTENYINKLRIEDGNGCALTFPVNVTYIDQNESFTIGPKPSPYPKAEIQIKRETSELLVLRGLK